MIDHDKLRDLSNKAIGGSRKAFSELCTDQLPLTILALLDHISAIERELAQERAANIINTNMICELRRAGESKSVTKRIEAQTGGNNE